MGQHEPYWRTNTSFSPTPSRWEFSFPSEEPLYDSNDGNLLIGSLISSNSKESRGMRANHLYGHQCTASDGVSLFSGSPPGPQWTPPAIQEISPDDYETAARRGNILQQLPSMPNMMGISGNLNNGGSTSSFWDNSESELTFKSCLSSHCNFSGRRSFLAKPVHPLVFPTQSPREASETTDSGFSEFDAATLQRDSHLWSSGSSSVDLADISDPFDSETLGRLCISYDGFKCGLCKRFLSQRSSWSSRRIVRSGDMPVAGVLSCHHVFHAECLEHATPKAHENDPPCPICMRLEEENSPELRVFPTLRNGFPSLKPSSEEGPSRPRGCALVGKCVESLHAPQQNVMLLLNRNRVKKNLSLKGNSSKRFPGKLRQSGAYSSQILSGKSVDLGTVVCSKTTAGPSTKR